MVTLVDLAGHERYFKTTAYGLTGHLPDYACLIVGANAGEAFHRKRIQLDYLQGCAKPSWATGPQEMSDATSFFVDDGPEVPFEADFNVCGRLMGAPWRTVQTS